MSSLRFLSGCAAPAAVLAAVFTAVPHLPPPHRYEVPAASPFLAERYAARPGGDVAALMRASGAMAGAGREEDAALLRNAWRRAVLGQALGEPPKLPASIAALLEEERADPKRLEPLAARALAAVRARVLPPAGNAISTRGLFVHYRVRVELANGLAVPITSVWVELPREGAGTLEARMRCLPEGPAGEPQAGVPLAPGRTAIYLCTGGEHADRAPAREAALPAPGTIAAASQVNTPEYVLNALGAARLGGEPATQEGEAAARAASCRELAICGQVALRAWLEVKRHRHQLGFLAWMALLGSVAWAAARARDADPPADAVRSVAATLATVAWIFALLMVYWALNPYMGLAALAVLGIAAIAAGASLALGLALAWLLHRRRDSITRLRVFTAAMSLAAPAGATAFLFALGGFGGKVA